MEAQKLFSTIIIDLSLQLGEFSHMLTLSKYIQKWKLALLEMCFFGEVEPKDAIQESKLWE